MAGNKKLFNVSVASVKSMSFIMDFFDSAFSLIFRIKQKIQIQFISKASLKALSNILIKKVKITISGVKFIGKQIQTINIKNVKLGVILKEVGKIVQIINLGTIHNTYLSSARSKLVTNIIVKKIKIGLVGLYGTFYSLGVYDPQTLGTLDTQTLGTMDFTIIP
jgi:hypothetical protein